MKFSVQLDAAERERLNALISKGKAPAKMILKARILLKTDAAGGAPGWLDAEIVAAQRAFSTTRSAIPPC